MTDDGALRITRLEDGLIRVEGVLSSFIEKQDKSAFGKKDLVTIALGAAGIIGSFFAGSVYLIDTRVAPVNASLQNVIAQTNDRLTSQADTQRAANVALGNMQIAIGDVRVEQTKLQDAGALNTQRWSSFYAQQIPVEIASQRERFSAMNERVRRLEGK